jgi:hypothetical protein
MLSVYCRAIFSALSVEGSRTKRKERYLSVTMDVLKDSEWHSLHARAR